jgi:hypothetical protein
MLGPHYSTGWIQIKSKFRPKIEPWRAVDAHKRG